MLFFNFVAPKFNENSSNTARNKCMDAAAGVPALAFGKLPAFEGIMSALRWHAAYRWQLRHASAVGQNIPPKKTEKMRIACSKYDWYAKIYKITGIRLWELRLLKLNHTGITY